MANENTMDQVPSVSPEGEEDRRSAGAKADECLARGKEVWTDAVRRVQDFKGDTEQYVRANPAKAVFAALGIGFVLGFVRRR